MLPLDTKTEMFIYLLGIARAVKKLLHICGILLKDFVCRELPAFIIKRLPVRLERNNNYFNDIYQGIPVGGYNKLSEGLLKDVETRGL